MVLLIVDGTFHWLQNILAFTLMKIVNPLTYSVANVTKRIAVISGSLVMMKNEVLHTLSSPVFWCKKASKFNSVNVRLHKTINEL